MSLFAIENSKERINLLIQMALITIIINKKWGYVLKRAIRFETIRHRLGLVARERKRVHDWVKDQDEAMKARSAAKVKMKAKRMESSQHVEVNHLEDKRIVMTSRRAVDCDGIKAAG